MGIFYLMFIIAITCGFLGVYMVLKKQTMIIDAISHSVFLGIVIAIMIIKKNNPDTQPYQLIGDAKLIISAIIFGFVCVALIEMLIKTKLVKEDAATGVIFPLLFALSIFLITRYVRNLNVENALGGDVFVILYDKIDFVINIKSTEYLDLLNINVKASRAAFMLTIVMLLTFIYIGLLYKELKTSIFDPTYSKSINFSLNILHYSLMVMVSTISVVAFNIIGVIVAISFFSAIPSAAVLYAKKLKNVFKLVFLFSLIVTIAFKIIISIRGNIDTIGLVATLNGFIFLIAWLTNRDGLIKRTITRIKKLKEYKLNTIIIHLVNHKDTKNEEIENGIETIKEHINIKEKQLNKYINILLNDNLISKTEKTFNLTEEGKKRYKHIKEMYDLN